MPTSNRTPALGEMVIYHERVRQDLWDPEQTAPRPAVVTEVLRPAEGETLPGLRLTVLRPYEKPLWDVTAHYSATPRGGHWSWREPGA
jgi:hypothetical protein